ncbi:MAG: 4-(cytidine 5'-diphospho)-2-C-methyl-D-erythritol kinase [Flavobacteriales bacterium]|jgi:4-diphosphocytidyl-2-C-methyl-D-erythritol kinase|nr:4-(cytidine 5'-diphospho)-2-C-methyl-D-erythritol kinase [Flavobacteriales bacterium]
MIYYPNAKINIGLNVFKKRADGYHLLKSHFYPVPLKDILEIVPTQGIGEVFFTKSGIEIDGNQNLCEQAYHLIHQDFPLPSVKIHLHKQIPIGAGLGGGSADASFTLKALNELFNLEISKNKLEEYAKKLGADCPFFIENTPKYVQGIGEKLSSSKLDLSGKFLVFVFPKIHISTKMAYQNLQLGLEKDFENATVNSLLEQPELFYNDFESSIFRQFPELSQIKNKLIDASAFYASMSGSGSTIFGLFENEPKNLNFQEDFKLLKL